MINVFSNVTSPNAFNLMEWYRWLTISTPKPHALTWATPIFISSANKFLFCRIISVAGYERMNTNTKIYQVNHRRSYYWNHPASAHLAIWYYFRCFFFLRWFVLIERKKCDTWTTSMTTTTTNNNYLWLSHHFHRWASLHINVIEKETHTRRGMCSKDAAK